MKLVHWIHNPNPATGTSGFYGSAAELIKAERAILGDASVMVCDSDKDSGEFQMRSGTTSFSPWEVCKDPDAVNIIHTYPPYTRHDMKRKIFMAQGIPEYCWWDTLLEGAPVWWQVGTLVRECDATICWFKRDTQYWKEMSGSKVVAIRRGIDLEFWAPGQRNDPRVHPYLLYADSPRPMKYPFGLLYAVKMIQRIHPYVYLKLILGIPRDHINWSNLITELGMQSYVPVVFGLLTQEGIRQTYIDVDITVSPMLWGLTPRTVPESLACGTPVVCLKGDDEPIYGLRAENDDPEGLSNAILKVWDKMVSDPDGERLKARQTAKKYWDVADTARAIIKVCEEIY